MQMVDRTPGPEATRPHGTRAAIRRHERHGEKLCEECRVERNRLAREMYAKRNHPARPRPSGAGRGGSTNAEGGER